MGAMYWLLPLVFVASYSMTWGVRRYALHRNLVDVPNLRSSHTVPTPRAGGVAIVLSLLLALPVTAWLGLVPLDVAWSIGGAGLGVAVIGFLDDHGHIPARWRLCGHFLAAAWALFWTGGLPSLDWFGVTVQLGWIGHVLAAVWLVWSYCQIWCMTIRQRSCPIDYPPVFHLETEHCPRPASVDRIPLFASSVSERIGAV